MLSRIYKMLLAQSASTAITVLTQLILPPVFLHSYGTVQYGEWLVLSATLTYLSTLNFGITTYASNELTMLHQRGESDRYRTLQASSSAVLLCLVGFGSAISILVYFLPLTSLFNLRTMSSKEAGIAASFLGLQMMAHILGGYYNNLFMVIKETHRGTGWYNLRRLGGTAAAVVLALFHLSFAVIALGQFLAVLIIALATIIDLRIRMRGLPLGLRGARWNVAKSTLVPSGKFAMVFTQTFLLFQVPVILLQRLLGPEVVVLFTISRTVLATARQILSTITNAIAPEITFSFGSGDMANLLAIFHYSEKVVFSLIPVANLGTLLFSPLLLSVWLHRPSLFDPTTYGLMALISAAMSMREHKQFFQFSTNRHGRLAHIVFWGNIAMILVSIPPTIHFGILGFMGTWLVSEIVQMVLLFAENRKLFDNDQAVSLGPVWKLVGLMAVSLPLCLVLVSFGAQRSQFILAVIATSGTLALSTASYFIFGIRDLRAHISPA